MKECKKKKKKKKKRTKTKKGKHEQRTCRSGFKIVKMAVRNFDVFEVFFGQLEVKICKFCGDKKRLFLQKGGQGSSKVNTFLVYVDL